MASILTNLYKEYQESLPHADPRTRDWLLLWRNPVYVWVITAAYLLFVWLGPKVMRNRKPLDCQWLLVVYNLGLVALSVYMVVEIILAGIGANYNFICTHYGPETWKNPKELRMAKVLWWYFFSKAIELMDTVLMVLRKKDSQITFLHVYHHASMLNIWWWVMMFIPGGCAYFGSGLNCLVHVVMYAYYGLSAIPSLRKHLWWKRYITKFQLTQFVITLSHTLATIYYKCDFPEWGKILLAGYMVSMLILFGNFYAHAYLSKKMQHSKDASKVTKTNGVQNGTTEMYTNGMATNGHAMNGNKVDKKHN